MKDTIPQRARLSSRKVTAMPFSLVMCLIMNQIKICLYFLHLDYFISLCLIRKLKSHLVQIFWILQSLVFMCPLKITMRLAVIDATILL